MHIKVASDNDAINLSKLLNDGNWMVLYYADWCGHCNTMKPEWQKVVSNLNNPQNNTNKVNVAEIESTHIGKLLNKPDIEGFPTIKMYNKGKEIANFEDERVATKIEEFANNNSKKEAKETNVEPNIKTDLSKINIELDKNNLLNNSKQNNYINIIKELKPNKLKPNKLKPNELKMNNLIMKINNNMKSTKNKKDNQPKINILDLPCSNIIKAKPCKSNPKCMYDGKDFKCKDKILKKYNNNIFNNKLEQNNMIGHIISGISKKTKSSSKKTKSPSKKTKSPSKKTKVSHNNKKYNVKKTTKSVFDQLIKSFERIGDEAVKDSKLLKNASNKLS